MESHFFLPYQRRWIDDRSPLRIMEKGRQIGMTTADAYDSVKKAVARDNRLDVWVSSRDLATAREYLRICKRWAQTLQIASEGPEWEVIDARKDLGAYTLRFKSGRCIFSLSSNPDALVGKTGHIKLDEFAIHRDQEELYRVAKPCTTWGGQLSIISTHRGDQTVFYEILDGIKHGGNPMGWSHHRVTLQDAVAAGLVERINAVRGLKNPPPARSASGATINDIDARRAAINDVDGRGAAIRGVDGSGAAIHGLDGRGAAISGVGENASHGGCTEDPKPLPAEAARPQSLGSAARAASGFGETREEFLRRLRAECLDEEQWLQEYCCVPADDDAAFITHGMITQCEEPGCLWPDVTPLTDLSQFTDLSNPLYVGVDVARKEHLSVIDVGEQIGDVIWDRMRIELRNATFSEIEEELRRILRLRPMQRACIDATGMGMQLAENMEREFGWTVEAVTFTPALKERLAYGLRTALEQRRVRLDPEPRLRADLRSIRKEVTASGNVRFAGESQGSHCDRFWAKALRQHAAEMQVEAGAAVL